MVGTRRASEHGLAVSRFFARQFASRGLAVVSGLALGVDAASHRGALDAAGRTIGIVGSGIDDASLYPRANLRLAREILKCGGLMISENPPGTKPQNWDFPKRNRLIAALSAATVVVEAPIKSGALITAKSALELGREVYAVPADALRESAAGSNGLIADGAAPLLSAERLVEDCFPGLAKAKKPFSAYEPAGAEEAAILKELAKRPLHTDDLADAAGLPVPVIQSILTALELKGAVNAMGNMRWTMAAAPQNPDPENGRAKRADN